MPDIFSPRLEDMLFLRQPSAHWQVVELQTEPGCCYRNRTGDECLRPGFTKREELLLDEPRIEVIHKRIVYDIEREGDVAKERADAGTETVGCCSARSQPYYRRENQNDAHCFENTIQHDSILHDAINAAHTTAANHALYIRYVEEQEKNDGTDPERTLYLELDAMENTPQQHPFTDVYTGIAQTRKRAIPTENVSQIKSLQSVKDLTPKEEMARDTFLMSFYLRGISFIDLAHLRKSDLKDGYLYYTRSKTRQRLTIRWEKEMQELMEKYQAQTASSSYLFPFLVDDGNKRQDKTIDKMQEEARLYHNAEARISYHLRKLGTKIGIKGKLTLYIARHSWATAARDNDVSISVISEALGHHSETTTQIYLRSIKSSEVDDANAKILAAL